MKFAVEAPDYGASPYTGMKKKHWIDACHFLLDGIFQQPATALVFHIYLGLCRIHRKDECGGCCGIGFCIYIAGAVNKDFHIYIRRIEWVLQKPIVEF